MVYLNVKHEILSTNILIKYLNNYYISFIAKYILVRPAIIIYLSSSSFACSSNLDWVRLIRTTFKPFLANSSAYALPMPSVQPVTIAHEPYFLKSTLPEPRKKEAKLLSRRHVSFSTVTEKTTSPTYSKRAADLGDSPRAILYLFENNKGQL